MGYFRNTKEVEIMTTKFKKLEKAVEKEYEAKGLSKERAEYIGRAVAGQVARRKRLRA